MKARVFLLGTHEDCRRLIDSRWNLVVMNNAFGKPCRKSKKASCRMLSEFCDPFSFLLHSFRVWQPSVFFRFKLSRKDIFDRLADLVIHMSSLIHFPDSLSVVRICQPNDNGEMLLLDWVNLLFVVFQDFLQCFFACSGNHRHGQCLVVTKL